MKIAKEAVDNFLKSKLSTIALMFSLIATICSGLFYFDFRYALASDHIALEQRVSYNEINYLYRMALEEYHFYKQQSTKYPHDQDIQLKLEQATSELEMLKKEREKLKPTARQQ